MPFPTRAIAAVAAGTAVGLLLRREKASRRTAERFAAASLETLLNAIDANDADTGTHVRRVATYALILADAAGVSDHERKVIERVALFHDIGKIHEALFDIIHDDKRLNRAERRAIATHPKRGAEVLGPLNGFYPELPEGVLSHHEKWDGSGYPRHLKGHRIPLAARIVAIADTFDAVTHRRRYRGAQSIKAGLDVIIAGRGTQFDPELVDLFTFPAVFEQIAATERKVAAWSEPPRQRRTGRDEPNVPDITFRWRPGRQATRGRASSDQTRQEVR
ncbi:MAG: metal-dependent phosphohydrolase region [Gemmatimonadetes bacterium]|jgi:putative nucleotidyltransferase with HDIG domain|nr:metal-dependent phosphohydrolase region [Gemmatimonadota bacterium]